MAEISKDRKAFLKKWAKLREIMAGFEWEKDGTNLFPTVQVYYGIAV